MGYVYYVVYAVQKQKEIPSQMIYQNFVVKVYGLKWQLLTRGMNGLKVHEK